MEQAMPGIILRDGTPAYGCRAEGFKICIFKAWIFRARISRLESGAPRHMYGV
jgi:hypothetical protein